MCTKITATHRIAHSMMTSSLTSTLFWDECQLENRQFSDLSLYNLFTIEIFAIRISWWKTRIRKILTCLICILHASLQITKMPISHDLQVVWTSNLDKRYPIRKAIDCHYFDLVATGVLFKKRNMCEFYKLISKIFDRHVIKPKVVPIVSFLMIKPWFKSERNSSYISWNISIWGNLKTGIYPPSPKRKAHYQRNCIFLIIGMMLLM